MLFTSFRIYIYLKYSILNDSYYIVAQVVVLGKYFFAPNTITKICSQFLVVIKKSMTGRIQFLYFFSAISAGFFLLLINTLSSELSLIIFI